MSGFVLQQFDGDVAEWLVGQVARDVSEVARPEADFAILQFHRHWTLAFHFIGEVRGPQCDVNIIMVMDVHQRRIVRRDPHLKHAHILVFKSEVVTRLGGNLDLRSLLRSQIESSKYQ